MGIYLEPPHQKPCRGAILPSPPPTVPQAKHKGWQSLPEAHKHKGRGEAFRAAQKCHLIREQPKMKLLQPATIFSAAGDAPGIDRQLPGSLTLPATLQSALQLKRALPSGASYSWEKLAPTPPLLRGSEHPGKSGEVENRHPRDNRVTSHELCTGRGWGGTRVCVPPAGVSTPLRRPRGASRAGLSRSSRLSATFP